MSISIRVNVWLWLTAMAVVVIRMNLGCSEVIADDPQDKPASFVKVPEVIIEKVVTEAVEGDPLGAGRIEVVYLDDHGPVIYPDQRLVLEAMDQRAHYVTFHLDYQQSQSDSPYQVKRIETLFLAKGDKPIKFSLRGPNEVLVDESIDPAARNAGEGNRILRQWWEAFSSAPEGMSAPERELHDASLEILARRHGLPLPHHTTSNRGSVLKSSRDLEAQFERAVGMLLGIESVKLAMQDDVTLRESTLKQTADQPIPRPPQMRSLQVPAYHPVPIERIAMRVPAECFYLRTGSLSNYFYFRDFLVGWGGSLNDIVSPRAFDHDIRRKIETQLSLDTSKMEVGQWDHLISDLALIGCDPLFHDGAAVGVLLESNAPKDLIKQVQQQRFELRKQHPDAIERRVKLRNRWVSVLSTPDYRVRSFYVIDGAYHLITNSEHLVDRFLDTADGDRSLGQLNEFGYAKSKANSDDSTRAFLYLSDPFFQNLISPHYRIEMTRRAVAKRALRNLQLAHLLAEAEGIPLHSVKDLTAANFLPLGFAERPDGSSATYRDGRYFDTLRGASGTFLPVADVPLQKATWTEVAGYQRFIADYNREWGRIDPVSVVFSGRNHPEQNGLSQISLDIIVAPYARRRYALLDTHLADADSMQLTPVEGDLISVQAAVRLGPSSPAHLLSVGLQDDHVPFALEHGQVKRLGEKPDATFAESRCYAAITPPSTDVLRMLASVLLEGKSPPPSKTTRSQTQPPQNSTFVPIPPMTPAPIQALYYMTWGLSNMPPGALGATKYLSMIETRDGITVVSKDDNIRDRIHGAIAKQPVADPHEVKLKIASLNGSQAAPYIQAYTYVDARLQSTQNAQLLNRWTDWLRLPPDRARVVVEELLGARVCCPLSGDFVALRKSDHSDWTSTVWTEPSRFEVSEIPPDWEFPFLRWLQGLTLDFDLGQNTLTARIDVTTRSHTVDHNERNRFIGRNPIPANVDPDPSHPLKVNATPTASTDSRPTSDWVLGVRVSEAGSAFTISSVYEDSPASRVGILAGDVIRKINHQIPESSEDISRLIRRSQQSGFVWLELNRNGSKIQMRVPL